jgi:histidinol phosphatase-like PHP family hydrolase
MENNVIKMDLHVHTPASLDYKGENSSDEYISILKRYIEKEVQVIAITDHNTIEGYKKLMSLRDDTKQIINSVRNRDIPNKDDFIKSLEDELSLYDKITIIPGIEVDLKPGIHMLVLFNPSIKLSELDEIVDFIAPINLKSCKESEIHNYSREILECLNYLDNKENCIVIAAHVDSNKGIYNDITKNNYRASIYTHKRLDAMEYLNDATKNKISSLLKQPQYKRDAPLAFIQSSDYHGISDVGNRITYLISDNYEGYKTIKAAFRSPDLFLSNTPDIEEKKVMEAIINRNENVICFKDLDEEGIAQAITAVMNERKGYVFIGIAPITDHSISYFGVDLDRSKIIMFLENIINKIDYYTNRLTRRLLHFQLGNGKYVYLVGIGGVKGISFYNDCVYILEKNRVIQADGKKLVEASEKALINEQSEFYESKIETIKKLQDELHILQKSFEYFSVLRGVEKKLMPISKIVNDIKIVSGSVFLTGDEFDGIGTFNGNLLIVPSFPFHLDNCYLRASVPRIEYDEDLPHEYSDFKFGEYIFMSRTGASYYAEINTPVSVVNFERSDIHVSYLMQNDSKYSAKVLLAWLKSSLFYYFSHEKGFIDNFLLFDNLMVPEDIDKASIEFIEYKMNKIIELELDFLVTM